MAGCCATVQPASHSPAALRLSAAYAALAVTYGRAPYVKSQFQLLTYKYDAFVPAICRMAELFRKKDLPNGKSLCYNTEVAKTKHVCGFWRWCRSSDQSIGAVRERTGFFGRVKHTEEKNQKEKRHECNFNETVT